MAAAAVKDAVKEVVKEKKTHDRFIPNRFEMDVAAQEFQKKTVNKYLDGDELAYQQEIAKACGVRVNLYRWP